MGLARQSAVTLAWQVATFAAQVVTSFILNYLLGPADRGTLAALMLIPSALLTAFHLSLQPAILSRYARSPGATAMTALGLAAGLGAAGTATGLLAWFVASDQLFPDLPRPWVLLMILQMPFLVMQLSSVALLQGAQAVVPYNVVQHAPRFLVLGAVVLMMALGRGGVGDLVVAFLGISAGVTAVGVGWAVRQSGGGRRWDPALARDLVSGGLRVHLGAVAMFAAARCSVFILQYPVTTTPALAREQLGYFTVAQSLAEVLWFPAMAVEVMLIPRLAAAPAEEGHALAERATRSLLWLTALGAAVAWALAPWLVRLYGGEAFLPAVPAFRALLPGYLLYVVARMLGGIWVRDGRFGFLGAAACVTALISVGLNLGWAPQYGAAGAAWGTGAAYGACGLIFIVAYRIGYGGSLRRVLIPQRGDLDAWRSP